jgi:hypothetical protein
MDESFSNDAAIEIACKTKTTRIRAGTHLLQSNQHPVKEPEEGSSGWAGRPQAARCAFMGLISPGFRSLRAIFRS